MEVKIKQIISNVFLVDPNLIDENTSQDSLPQWDSIGHLNLITSIEEEFGVFFTEDQIIEMLNFRLVCLITKEAIDAKEK